jgi:hypothetical protein
MVDSRLTWAASLVTLAWAAGLAPAVAQYATPTQKHAAAASSPFFAVQPWVSLSQGPSLIRDPNPPPQMDLAAREDQTFVTVYAHKKREQSGPGAGRRVDGDEAAYSDASTPWDLPVAPPTNCSNGAYQTIGGQPANGADLMGPMARGC